MGVQQARQQAAPSDFDWSRIGMISPPWLLRMKMGWIESEIHELERLLDDEFGLSETAPLHQAHVTLLGKRDALQRRLIGTDVSH